MSVAQLLCTCTVTEIYRLSVVVHITRIAVTVSLLSSVLIVISSSTALFMSLLHPVYASSTSKTALSVSSTEAVDIKQSHCVT
jgi:hypothetical protein